jgi:hypothetical protein
MSTLSQFTFVPRMVSGTPSYPGAQVPNYTLVSPGGAQETPAGGASGGTNGGSVYHDPSGLVGSGPYYDIVYNDIVQGNTTTPGSESVTNISANLNGYTTGGGAGKRVGVIGYDYLQKFWSVIWLVPGVILVNNGQLNDAGAIKDFCASLALLPATNPVEFNDAYAPQASLPSLD